jgi:hypothetical protein
VYVPKFYIFKESCFLRNHETSKCFWITRLFFVTKFYALDNPNSDILYWAINLPMHPLPNLTGLDLPLADANPIKRLCSKTASPLLESNTTTSSAYITLSPYPIPLHIIICIKQDRNIHAFLHFEASLQKKRKFFKMTSTCKLRSYGDFPTRLAEEEQNHRKIECLIGIYWFISSTLE